MAKLQHRAWPTSLALSRRGFLIGAAGTGFAFGFAAADALRRPPLRRRCQTPSIRLSGTASTATASSPSTSSAPRWASMSARRSPASSPTSSRPIGTRSGIDAVDTDPKWGLMVTGGSWSVWMTFPVFSRAGAAGRIALVEAGAKLLGVPADQCSRASAPSSPADRSISYAEIVSAWRSDAAPSPPMNWRKMPIKPASRAAPHRAQGAGDRYSRQDQRHSAVRDRCCRRRHGLCAAQDSADA